MTTVEHDYPEKCTANLFSIFKFYWLFSILSPSESLKVRIKHCFCNLVSQKVWLWTWSYSDLYHNYLNSSIEAFSSIESLSHAKTERRGVRGRGKAKPKPGNSEFLPSCTTNTVAVQFPGSYSQGGSEASLECHVFSFLLRWWCCSCACSYMLLLTVWDLAMPVKLDNGLSPKNSVWPPIGLDFEVCVIGTVEVDSR